MNWIYDERTSHSRLMVGYDRNGITIREWSDDTPFGEDGFVVTEGWFTWEQYRKRDRGVYSGDDGSRRLKQRLVAGAISLLSYYGGHSDDSGVVPSLDHYINGHHIFTC
jgi:hypothetical protein